jgi:hypothetical protein
MDLGDKSEGTHDRSYVDANKDLRKNEALRGARAWVLRLTRKNT